jgi:hypothetical protein
VHRSSAYPPGSTNSITVRPWFQPESIESNDRCITKRMDITTA